MKRYYSYAGVNICIEGNDEWMYQDDRMLKSFRVDTLEDPDVFSFEVVDTLKKVDGMLVAHDAGFLEFEEENKRIRYIGSVSQSVENAYMRVEHNGKKHNVTIKKESLKDRIPVHTIYLALESERLMMHANAMIMHASYIEYKGKAVLFTAPSGTGKSTQADLWKKYRKSTILNGDRVAIQNKNGQFFACGVPFAGSSNICVNKTLPLACVVSLGQAENTTIREINGFEAFLNLYEGSGILTWDKKHVAYISDFLDQLIKNVPIYKLDCTPDESAVMALEKKLEV